MKERWQRLSVRERLLASVMGVGVLAIAVHSVVIIPYLSYRQELEDGIARETSRLEKALHQVGRGPTVERRLEQLRQRYHTAEARLLPGATPQLAAAQLQTRVQHLAGQSQMEAVSAQVLKITQVGEFQRAAVQLQLRGNLPALAVFLAEVEYDAGLLTIDRLDIRSSRRRQRYRRRRLRRRTHQPLTVTVVIGGLTQGSAPTVIVKDGAHGEGGDKEA